MLEYWLQMVVKAIISMPEFLGGNWRGFALTCFAIAIPEIKEIRKNGFGFATTKRSRIVYVLGLMKRHWRENAEIAMVIVVLFFGGHLLDVVYQDRHELSVKAGELDKFGREVSQRIDQATQPLKSQIDTLKTECAVKEAINQTIQKQNRDEQLQIAACHSDEIKRLMPEPQKTTVVFFDNSDPANPQAKYATRWLVLTNKPMAPFKVDIFCYAPVSSVRMETVGSRNTNTRMDRVTSFQYLATQDNPPFTASSPLLFTVDSDVSVSCSFSPHL